MTCQKAKLPFRIEDNILIGEEDPFEYDSTSLTVGELILNTFKAKPDWVGQVDAMTGKQSTFQQMRERSVKCALWLRKQEIKPDDVVVTCTGNQMNAYIPFLASLYIGALTNPWNEHFDPGNTKHFLKLSSPKVIFVNGDKAAQILEIAMKLRVSVKIVVYDEVEGFESLESILDDGHFDETDIKEFSCTTPKKGKRDTVLLMSSSGTTGLPKIVEVPQVIFTIKATRQSPEQSPGDVGLWFGSLSWITSAFLTIRTILSYATALKCTGFDSEEACRIIEKYKVNWMFMESTMCNQLLQSGIATKYDTSSLRKIYFGGSFIYPDVHENIVKTLPHISIEPVYGMTEIGLALGSKGIEKFGSSGYVSANIRLMIVDVVTGRPLGPNMSGEICIKSPSMMNGYYKNPESTKNAFDKYGWFHTGDCGYYDEDGAVFITDRIKRLIKYRGHQISPTEVEIVLHSHPAVYQAVVAPVPHRLDGQHPIAFVKKVPGAEVTEEELERLVAENLGDQKKLRKGVVFVDDVLRLPNGKVDLNEFRNMAKMYATE